MNEFEQHLSRQPQRQIPPGWRAEILAAARDAQAASHVPCPAPYSWLSTINYQLSTLLWPHPKAWAGLAAVWILIMAVNVSLRDEAPGRMAKISPPSPEVVAQLKKQQRMFAELVGSYETSDADRQKNFAPKPRSERMEFLVA